MTNQSSPIPPKSKSWTRYLLVVSLGLNLLIIGLVAGAVMRGGPPEHTRKAGAERNFGVVGLRLYARSLNATDRADLRAAIVENKNSITAGRDIIQAHLQGLAQALRSDPFDPAAVAQILSQQREQVQNNIGLGHDLLSQQIATMTPEQRLDFADNLEKHKNFGKRRP